MRRYTLADLLHARAQGDEPYLEFLRVPSMSAGIYELAAGAVDRQQPHTEDELYYIVSGKATLLMGDTDVPVEAGSLVFVPANMVHRFHSITEALRVLVLFAPAEYTFRDA